MDAKKVERAIKLIQAGAEMAEKAGQPIEIAYSGGKDSDVILELAKMAGGLMWFNYDDAELKQYL